MRSAGVKLGLMAVALWWCYLFFATQFVVVFDSEGYEKIGQLIAHQGWGEFFRAGPQREPLFPWIIAVSMQLGDWWGISYHCTLKMIGIVFLSLTMVFSYRLMRMLAISRWIAYLFVFYLGLSPTMSTSSVRLWSEFAAYPWVPLAVIWTIKSWRLLDNSTDEQQGYFRMAGHALMVALSFLLIMSVKAVAEGVLLLYLWPFYGQIISYWVPKNFIKARQVLLFCLTVLIVFEGAVNIYKWENYRYNGHYTFTTRGDYALYGNIARRMEPLTLKRLGAAVAFVPGMGLCQALYSPDDCDFWSARHSDDIISQKTKELDAQGVKDEAASKYFIDTSIKMMLSNPLQAFLLMFIEGHEMFFWEPTIAFVVYPDWLEKIFYSPVFYYTTMITVSFITWVSCVFVFFYLCYHYWKPSLRHKEQDDALGWVFNFIFWYIAFYSLFFILDRYAFPIVSLFIVLIAFLVHQITKVFVK